MKPTRTGDDALVDLVDVILEEGVVLQADVIISVAEVPLVGLKLRAALAGMETMTEYGLFVDWEERIKGDASNDRRSVTLGGERTAGVARRPEPRSGGDEPE